VDRILIVEDDDDSREALAELLEGHGYDVETARDGVEAVEVAEKTPPTLVISDVNMPRRDGFALVGVLRDRAACASVPIILLSALSERERRVAGLDLGADDYLGKPVDADELLARVRVHLRHAHRQQELEQSSLLDPLTGVLNRRGLMAALHREHERVLRGRGSMSVMLIDVDDFKALNDTQGHAAGDQALRDIARAITEAVRAIDHVGRLGGDEFLVVVPDTDHAAGAALAERIAHLPVEVGLSVGHATLRPGETAEQLLARADAEMYERKRRRKAQ
jgi:diguanylate cyclase (GGDEF)-like protein